MTHLVCNRHKVNKVDTEKLATTITPFSLDTISSENIHLKEIIHFSANNFDKWKKGSDHLTVERKFHHNMDI